MVPDTCRPWGCGVGRGFCVEWAGNSGLGEPPPGLSVLPSSTIYMATLGAGGVRGIEDRGTASNCCDLKSKEEELGTSQSQAPAPWLTPASWSHGGLVWGCKNGKD